MGSCSSATGKLTCSAFIPIIQKVNAWNYVLGTLGRNHGRYKSKWSGPFSEIQEKGFESSEFVLTLSLQVKAVNIPTLDLQALTIRQNFIRMSKSQEQSESC